MAGAFLTPSCPPSSQTMAEINLLISRGNLNQEFASQLSARGCLGGRRVGARRTDRVGYPKERKKAALLREPVHFLNKNRDHNQAVELNILKKRGKGQTVTKREKSRDRRLARR